MTVLINELRHRIEQLRGEHEKARAASAEAKRAEELIATDLAAFENALAAAMRHAGEAPQPQPVHPEDVGVNKTGLALSVISSGPPTGTSIDDLDGAFRSRGFALHRNYLFNIASRLKQQGKIEQRGGRYFVKQ